MRSNDLLTATQAAALLGVSPARVRRLILDGRLPATKMGRDHVISADALARYQPGVGGWPKGKPRKPASTTGC